MCASARRMRALLTGSHQGRRVAAAEIRGKPNCLRTGTSELFGGRISAAATRGLFRTGMFEKAPLLGALSLGYFSLGKQREVTRRRRKLLKPARSAHSATHPELNE